MLMLHGLVRRHFAAAILGGLLLLGCGSESAPGKVAMILFEGPQPQALDADVRWRASGFAPAEVIQVTATLVDDAGIEWRSSATYTTDSHGMVDSTIAAPDSGSYEGADSNGLIWSMTPGPAAQSAALQEGERSADKALAAHTAGRPYFASDAPFTVEFSAIGSQGNSAAASLERIRFDPLLREVEVSEDGLIGVLFEPPTSSGAIVLLSGSTGGVRREHAALLARHGYTVFALAYFNYPGRPAFQANLPLEYFRDAMDWLIERTGFDRVGLQGISRGAEVALQLGATYPQRVATVVSVAPSHIRFGAFDGKTQFAPGWTYGGEPLPYAGTAEDAGRLLANLPLPAPGEPFAMRNQFLAIFADADAVSRAEIQVENIRSPILVIAGEDDQLWPADQSCKAIESRLMAKQFTHPFECMLLADAGHGITAPGYPTTLRDIVTHPVTKMSLRIGGTPQGNAHAQRRAWRRILDFYGKHLL